MGTKTGTKMGTIELELKFKISSSRTETGTTM